jgi:hypothetical protein
VTEKNGGIRAMTRELTDSIATLRSIVGAIRRTSVTERRIDTLGAAVRMMKPSIAVVADQLRVVTERDDHLEDKFDELNSSHAKLLERFDTLERLINFGRAQSNVYRLTLSGQGTGVFVGRSGVNSGAYQAINERQTPKTDLSKTTAKLATNLTGEQSGVVPRINNSLSSTEKRLYQYHGPITSTTTNNAVNYYEASKFSAIGAVRHQFSPITTVSAAANTAVVGTLPERAASYSRVTPNIPSSQSHLDSRRDVTKQTIKPSVTSANVSLGLRGVISWLDRRLSAMEKRLRRPYGSTNSSNVQTSTVTTTNDFTNYGSSSTFNGAAGRIVQARFSPISTAGVNSKPVTQSPPSNGASMTDLATAGASGAGAAYLMDRGGKMINGAKTGISGAVKGVVGSSPKLGAIGSTVKRLASGVTSTIKPILSKVLSPSILDKAMKRFSFGITSAGVGLAADVVGDVMTHAGHEKIGGVLNTLSWGLSGASIGGMIGGPATAAIGGVLGTAYGVYQNFGNMTGSPSPRVAEILREDRERQEKVKESREFHERYWKANPDARGSYSPSTMPPIVMPPRVDDSGVPNSGSSDSTSQTTPGSMPGSALGSAPGSMSGMTPGKRVYSSGGQDTPNTRFGADRAEPGNFGIIRVPSAPKGLAANQSKAYSAARAAGLSDRGARILVANFSGEGLANPNRVTSDPSRTDRGHRTSQGIAQWEERRAERIRREFKKYPIEMTVEEQVRAAIWEMKTTPAYSKAWAALNDDTMSDGDRMFAVVSNYERPARPLEDTRRRLGVMRSLQVGSSSVGDGVAERPDRQSSGSPTTPHASSGVTPGANQLKSIDSGSTFDTTRMTGVGGQTPTASTSSGATPPPTPMTVTGSSGIARGQSGPSAPNHNKAGGSKFTSGDIVSLGRELQSMGLRVSEHPAFGGVHPVHSRNSKHYSNQAIDVNAGSGIVEANDPVWGKKFDEIAESARRAGYRVIWRASGHENHMHIDVGSVAGMNVAHSHGNEIDARPAPANSARAVGTDTNAGATPRTSAVSPPSKPNLTSDVAHMVRNDVSPRPPDIVPPHTTAHDTSRHDVSTDAVRRDHHVNHDRAGTPPSSSTHAASSVGTNGSRNGGKKNSSSSQSGPMSASPPWMGDFVSYVGSTYPGYVEHYRGVR